MPTLHTLDLLSLSLKARAEVRCKLIEYRWDKPDVKTHDVVSFFSAPTPTRNACPQTRCMTHRSQKSSIFLPVYRQNGPRYCGYGDISYDPATSLTEVKWSVRPIVGVDYVGKYTVATLSSTPCFMFPIELASF
jgi:hypothetical protein